MQRKNGETPHHGSDPTDFSKLSMRQERSSNSFLTRAACQSRKENVQQQNSGVQTRGNGDAAGRWAPKKRPSNRDTMNDSEVMKLMAIALHPKEKCFFFFSTILFCTGEEIDCFPRIIVGIRWFQHFGVLLVTPLQFSDGQHLWLYMNRVSVPRNFSV